MELQTIRLEKTESVATITLNRPEKMNAYNSTMLDELSSVLEDVALDKDIRAVIITGEGRAFCAGADVQDIGALLSLQDELSEKQDILKLLIRFGSCHPSDAQTGRCSLERRGCGRRCQYRPGL
jgi:enoyl-CoA hydratase/carnithine racemase